MIFPLYQNQYLDPSKMSYNNYSQITTDTSALDEDFLHPLTSIGEVLVNAEMASGSVTSAMQNNNAKYPLPSGQSLQMVGRTRRCAVAYRLIDEGNYMNNSFGRGDSSTVSGITSINGQGYAGESQASFMSRIQPIGIVQQETENNGDRRFNIHIGGLYTVVNNGNRDIVAGDWVMVYAPRLDEIKEGGRGKDHDINGYYELWLVPYHPSLHQATSASIYACLTQRCKGEDVHYATDGRPYVPEYERMCEHLMDAFMDNGVIFIEYLRASGFLANIAAAPTSKDRADLYAGALGDIGHSHFYSKKGINRELRQECINAFFLDRLSSSKANTAYTAANYFTGNDVNSRKMRECQLEAVSLALTEQANFIHTITKNVIGKAVTSGAPKKNFDMQLCSMIGCK